MSDKIKITVKYKGIRNVIETDQQAIVAALNSGDDEKLSFDVTVDSSINKNTSTTGSMALGLAVMTKIIEQISNVANEEQFTWHMQIMMKKLWELIEITHAERYGESGGNEDE